MTERRDGLDSVRLDESAARRLIERATELDAKLASESTIADLREAARGAGISEEAFQRALAEVDSGHSSALAPVDLEFRHKRLRRLVMSAVVAGVVVVAVFVLLRMVMPTRFVYEPARAAPAAPALPSPR
jgi:hypothetical protein